MPIVSVSVIGDKSVLHGLQAMGRGLRDLRAFWTEEWAPHYFKTVQDMFATGGRRRGGGGRFKSGAWKPLSARYRAWKHRFYPGRPILVLEGRLQESVRWTGRSLGLGGVFEAHPRYVVFGTNVPYAAAHQKGVPARNLPAREFLPPPDPAEVSALMKAWLLKAQRRAARS